MNKKIAALELSNIHYQMYDEGEMKEYGLTREERLKKQFIEQRIDELYMARKKHAKVERKIGITIRNKHCLFLFVFLFSKFIE